MNKFYSFLFIFSLAGYFGANAQQQFTYTQYIDNLTPINPAWSLTRDTGSIDMATRKQWVNVDGAPSTFMLNGSQPIKKIDAVYGFTLLSDKVAIENLTEFNVFFGKSIKVGANSFLATAINGGFRVYNALYSTLDVNDPALFNKDIRETKGNIGASVQFFIPGKFYAGLSLPRLSIRKLGVGSVAGSLNIRNFYFLNLGYQFKISTDLELHNSVVIAYTANVPVQADIASKVWLKEAFGMGVSYRLSNEIAILSSYKTGSFRIGYSYQFGLGSTRLIGFNSGTHEVVLGYTLGRRNVTPKIDLTPAVKQ